MKITVDEQLRNLIRNQRAKHNISASDLSELIGRSKMYITQIETGKSHNIDEESLIELLKPITDEMSEEKFNHLIELYKMRQTIPVKDNLYQPFTLNTPQLETEYQQGMDKVIELLNQAKGYNLPLIVELLKGFNNLLENDPGLLLGILRTDIEKLISASPSTKNKLLAMIAKKVSELTLLAAEQ